MRTSARLLFLAFAFQAPSGPVLAQTPDIGAFLGPQGCAIGLGTRELAQAAGIPVPDLDDFAARAAALEGSYRTGDWLVVGPGLCRIGFPPIHSEVKPDDPEVLASLTAKDEYAGFDEPGCFLKGEELQERLQESRGWDENRAYLGFVGLVGAGLVSGEIVFNHPSQLNTPAGFQLITGDCADVPRIDAILQDQDLLRQHLDAVIRKNAELTPCTDGSVPVNHLEGDYLHRLTDGRYNNAWGWFEIAMIAMAAGWYDVTVLGDRGTPRPPLCRYEND